MSDTLFKDSLCAALRLPGAIVDRERFLTESLTGKATAKQIRESLEKSPSAAGIEDRTVLFCCNERMDDHLESLSTTSFLAGIPGGLALIGTIPADLAQYFLHMVVFVQEAAYLTGWRFRLSVDASGEMDEETMEILTIMMGTLFDIPKARRMLRELGEADNAYANEEIVGDEAIATISSESLKKIENEIELALLADTAVKGVVKFLPVLGSVANGTLAYLRFKSQAQTLLEALTSLKWAHKDFYHVPFVVE